MKTSTPKPVSVKNAVLTRRTAAKGFVGLLAYALSLATLSCRTMESDEDIVRVQSGLLAGMDFFFGNLHAHTHYSDGSGTPAEGYAFGRYDAEMDFYTITDHAELLSGSEWEDILNQSNNYNEDGFFVALRGFEYTNYLWGHINVFDTNSYRSFWQSILLPSFYSWLDDNDGIGQFNHPGDPGDFLGFETDSDVIDNMALIETANSDDTNAGGKYMDEYDNALRNGWRVAPTGNNDNHTLEDNGCRTVLVADGLSRNELLTAMRERRMYSSDDRNLEIAYLLDGRWMGSVVEHGVGTARFDVVLHDDEDLARIELIEDGRVAASLTPEAGAQSLIWKPELDVVADTYAYLRVTEADGEVAVTAPIWINVPYDRGG